LAPAIWAAAQSFGGVGRGHADVDDRGIWGVALDFAQQLLGGSDAGGHGDSGVG
jgi:hypothetical protein